MPESNKEPKPEIRIENLDLLLSVLEQKKTTFSSDLYWRHKRSRQDYISRESIRFAEFSRNDII